MTRTASTSELKAHCSQIIQEVARRRSVVLVTRRGRAVAKIVPFVQDDQPTLYGFARGIVTFSGDVMKPIGVAWEADE